MGNSFNILGCCVSRDLFEYNTDYQINRYVAFCSPLMNLVNNNPITDENKQRIINDVECSNFGKKCFFLDHDRKIFDYLSEENSDWLLIDFADIRIPLMKFKNGITVTKCDKINNYLPTIYGEFTLQKIGTVTFEDIEKAIKIHFDNILKMYNEDQIILNDLRMAKQMITRDNKLEFFRSFLYEEWELSKVDRLLEEIKEYIVDHYKNIHIINMPDELLSDQNNKWGAHPLHYTQSTYEYLAKAVQIITERKSDEREQLENLRQIYSLKNKLKKVEITNNNNQFYLQNRLSDCMCLLCSVLAKTEGSKGIKAILEGESNTLNYLKLLSKIKNHVNIYISVRDTAGNLLSDVIVTEICNGLGFSRFTKNYGIMYVGISHNGKILIDAVGTEKNAPVIIEDKSILGNIRIESMAYQNGDCSKIILNGIDYSVNIRGVNIVVTDPATGEIIDSIAFDHHFSPHDIARK